MASLDSGFASYGCGALGLTWELNLVDQLLRSVLAPVPVKVFLRETGICIGDGRDGRTEQNPKAGKAGLALCLAL